jgi:hypothetical protein
MALDRSVTGAQYANMTSDKCWIERNKVNGKPSHVTTYSAKVPRCGDCRMPLSAEDARFCHGCDSRNIEEMDGWIGEEMP